MRSLSKYHLGEYIHGKKQHGLKRCWRLETFLNAFFAPWCNHQNETFPAPVSHWELGLNAIKKWLTNSMIIATRKDDFLLKQARNHWEANAETSVSERLKRFETLFQMLNSMPRKTFKTVSFLVELIFYKINSLQKEAVKKDLFSSRDGVETLSPFALKRFRAEMFPCRFVSNHVVLFQTVLHHHGLNISWSHSEHAEITFWT